MTLPGTPSDDVDAVLAEGDGDITTLFVSMARRHPDGADADYLRWHTLDHRPEQHRLSSVRASLRLVSTPQCRAARIGADERFDPVDHVMTYFFTSPDAMQPFLNLSTALGNAGRKLPLLPPVERGVYDVTDKLAAPRAKVGADVLPWWPIRGAILLVDGELDSVATLLDVDGVVGSWTATALPVAAALGSARHGQRLTYCFLDDDPVATAARLAPVLRRTVTSLAAPFHVIVPHQWDRHLP